MDAAELLAAKQLREGVARVKVGDSFAEVKMRALPRKEYRRLLESHQSEMGDWDEDTFPAALIAACAVDPAFTLEQAQEAWDGWEAHDAGQLFLTAFTLNERSGVGFTSPGSATTGGSGQNSPT